MKVVFIKDCPKVAKSGEVKEFPDGYARNFLIKKGFASPVTDKILSSITRLQKEKQELAARSDEKNTRIIEKLNNKEFKVQIQTDKAGHPYGSVTDTMIIESIENKSGVMLDKKSIDQHGPIKQLGQHEVIITLSNTHHAKIKLIVESR